MQQEEEKQVNQLKVINARLLADLRGVRRPAPPLLTIFYILHPPPPAVILGSCLRLLNIAFVNENAPHCHGRCIIVGTCEIAQIFTLLS